VSGSQPEHFVTFTAGQYANADTFIVAVSRQERTHNV
jgi:hypothetical protein